MKRALGCNHQESQPLSQHNSQHGKIKTTRLKLERVDGAVSVAFEVFLRLVRLVTTHLSTATLQADRAHSAGDGCHKIWSNHHFWAAHQFSKSVRDGEVCFCLARLGTGGSDLASKHAALTSTLLGHESDVIANAAHCSLPACSAK